MKKRTNFNEWFYFGLIIFAAIAMVLSIIYSNWLNLFISSISFILFIILKSLYFNDDKNPKFTSIFLVLAIYFVLFLSSTDGVERSLLYFRVLLYLVIGVLIGLVSFLVLEIINNRRKVIGSDPLFISLFAFSFSIMIGTSWQVFRFSMNYLFGINIQGYNPSDSLGFLTLLSIGSAFITMLMFIFSSVDNPLKNFLHKNFKMFNQERIEDKIRFFLSQGEGAKVEFKETIRTNVHTKQHDKNIELVMLKTIVAYLNTEGGKLIVGVNDKGEIIGTDVDKFPNRDKLYLHLVHLFKEHIGETFVEYIHFQELEIDKKKILYIDVFPSTKEVFLKEGQDEIFYIRAGPSSVPLKGRKLLDYVSKRFN